MSTSSSQSLVDLWGVITESKRIINSHSRHFLALSVLFLLPLSFSLTVFPTLHHTFTHPTPNRIVSLLRHSTSTNHLHLPPIHTTNLIFSFLFFSFILTFLVASIATITYSVFHGFYGRPVKLLSAIISLRSSFLPLLGTFITAQMVVFFIFALFGMVLYVGIKGFGIGFHYDYKSPYFVGISLIGIVLLGLPLVYIAVNWYLMNVIVVVESKWGFCALVRSKGLVRGMRWVALSLMLYFGMFSAVVLGICMLSGDGYSGSVNDGWNTWGIVMGTVVTCAALTLLMLHGIAANTVLYMYCKALHGELAGDITNEFVDEYVSLPFDDQKIPHVVYYVQ